MELCKLKTVDDATVNLVYGYIRRSQALFEDKIIPDEITNICIIYYFVPEFFVKCGKYMKILKKHVSNDLISSTSSGDWSTAYGNQIINMNETPNMTYQWTIKTTNKWLIMGLESTDFKNLNVDLTNTDGHLYKNTNKQCKHYGWYTMSRLCSSYELGRKNTVYDTISPTNKEIMMELNCKSKSLKYVVDGKDHGIAFSNIDSTQNYRFAISMWDNGSLQLLNFQQKFQ